MRAKKKKIKRRRKKKRLDLRLGKAGMVRQKRHLFWFKKRKEED